MSSFSFDRAADYYDATRSLPDDSMDLVADLLAAEISGTRAFEIGIGTGRIALPLVERSIDIYGIDISNEMVQKMLAKRFDRERLHVALADATRLPFASSSFDSILAVHVLHLVPSWHAVCDEAVRVGRGGGRFIVDNGGWGKDAWSAIQLHFAEITHLERPRPGAGSIEEIDDYMGSLGATPRRLPTISTTRSSTYAELIHRIREGLYSFTWMVDEDERRRAADETAFWARERYGDLDEPRPMEWDVAFTAYELPER
ncbi:MAG: class I SAM-dependent methyltransferase [Actinomycetota bacterium]|nr:class I SAM-dependent methyltransferase [Actinomycetota bacterium]